MPIDLDTLEEAAPLAPERFDETGFSETLGGGDPQTPDSYIYEGSSPTILDEKIDEVSPGPSKRDVLSQFDEKPLRLSDLTSSVEWNEQKDPVKRLNALDRAAAYGSGYLRDKDGQSPDYEFERTVYEGDYSRIRNQVVDEGITRIALSTPDPPMFYKALTGEVDIGDLGTEESADLYQNMYKRAKELSDRKRASGRAMSGNAYAFTQNGVTYLPEMKRGDDFLGGMNMSKALDGSYDASFEVDGLPEKYGVMTVVPNVNREIVESNIRLDGLRENVTKIEKQARNSVDLDGWYVNSSNKSTVDEAKRLVSDEEKHLMALKQDGAEDYMALRMVTDMLRNGGSDQAKAVRSAMGRGWTGAIVAPVSQMMGGILDSVVMAGQAGTVIGGNTLDMLGVEGLSEKAAAAAVELGDLGESVKGEGIDIAGVNLSYGHGLSRAKFVGGFWNNTIVGLLNEAPSMALSGALGSIPEWAGKAAFKKVVKNQLKELGEEITTESIKKAMVQSGVRKFEKVANKFIAPTVAGSFQLLREGGGAWNDQMRFIDDKMGGFESLESMEEMAALLETEGKDAEAESLRGKARDADRAMQSLGSNMAVTMAIVGATEFLPFQKMYKIAGRNADDVFEHAFKSVLKEPSKVQAAFNGIVDLAVEKSGMEGLQEVLGNASAKAFYDDERGLFEGVPEALAIGFVLGSGGSYAATAHSFELQQEAARKIADGVTRASDLRKMAGNMVLQQEDGKYHLADRKSEDEVFDTFDEAAAFTPVRHQTRFLNNAREADDLAGVDPSETAAQLTLVESMARAAATAGNRSVEDIYEGMQVHFESGVELPLALPFRSEIRQEKPNKSETKTSDVTIDSIFGAKFMVRQDSEPSVLVEEMVAELDRKRDDAKNPSESKVLSDTKRVLEGLSDRISKGDKNAGAVARTMFKVGQKKSVSEFAGMLDQVVPTRPAERAEAEKGEKEALGKGLETLEAEVAGKQDPFADTPTPEELAKVFGQEEQAIREQEEATSEADEIQQGMEEDAAVEKVKVANERARRVKARDFIGQRPRIFKQEGKRGQVEVSANEAVIKIFKDGDASTLIHEFTHALDRMFATENETYLDLMVGKDKTAADFWEWVTDNGNIDRRGTEAAERIAKGVEHFIATNEAPKPGLEGAFRRMASAFKRIYKDFKKAFGKKLTVKAQKGFARFFEDTGESFYDALTDRIVPKKPLSGTNPEILYQDKIPPSEIPVNTIPVNTTLPIVMNPYTGEPEGVTPTDTRTLVAGVGPRFDAKVRKLAKKGLVGKAFDAILRPAGSQARGFFSHELMRDINEAEELFTKVAFEMEGISNDYRRLLKEEYGGSSEAAKVGREKAERALNDYLSEQDSRKKEALRQSLNPKTRAMATAMRSRIDEMSRNLIRSGAVSGRLAGIIEGSVGTYLHRAYQIFEDPSWQANVRKDDDIIRAAKEYFRREFEADTAEEQDRLVNYTLNPANFGGTPAGWATGRDLTVKQRNILKKRKDIAPEIRALWGEYKDPLKNYSASMLKLANLTSSYNKLKAIKERGLSEGWLFHPSTPNKPQWASAQITSFGNKSMEPLSGMLTSDDIAEQILGGFSTAAIDSRHHATYYAVTLANSLAKMSFTSINPGSQVRNFWSSALMFGGNGYIFSRDVFPSVYKGAKVGLREFTRKDVESEAFQETMELVGFRVLDQNINVKEFNILMRQAVKVKNASGLADYMIKKGEELGRRGLFQKANEFYRMGDSVWKAATYYSELASLRRVHGDKVSLKELKSEAAERTRAVMPNYSEAPQWVRSLSKDPVIGMFATFQAEAIRITANQLKIGAKDLATPGRRFLGARRLGAFAAVRGGILKGAAMMMHGVNQLSGDEEEKFRLVAAPWSRFSDIVKIGEDDKGNPIVITMDFMDPYAQQRKVFNAIKAVTSENAFSPSSREGIAAVGMEVVGPFTNPEFGLMALIEAKDAFDTNNIPRSLQETLIKLAKDYSKPTRKSIFRAFGGTDEEGVTPVASAMGFYSGFTPHVMDLEKGLYYMSLEMKDELNDMRKRFERGFSRNPSGALAEAKATQEGILRRYGDEYEAYIYHMRDEKKTAKVLTKGGISLADIDALGAKEPPPLSLTTTKAMNLLDDPAFERMLKNGEVVVVGRSHRELVSMKMKEKRKAAIK